MEINSEEQLDTWKATPERPVKVINFLLVGYIDPPIAKNELEAMGVINRHPQQSIYRLRHDLMKKLIERSSLEFST